MDADGFAELASWRYEPPYDFYDGDVEPVLNPERFFAARDESGALVGHYYFEERGDVLEYGLGLRPDLTGRGLGLEFFHAGLAFGTRAVRARVGDALGRRVQRARDPRLRAGGLPRNWAARADVRTLRRGGVRGHGADVIAVAEEVADALRDGRAVVALETTLVAHGFPPGEGVAVALESEQRVRVGGAVPATIGVLDGAVRVGLTEAELERFDVAARKVGARDLAVAVVQDVVGATTVGGTLAVCSAAGITFMATGGLGGVHRGWSEHPDVSSDLAELARAQVLVVSAGIKSLLDVPATAELLEALGVPVLGFRTDELPLFYAARGGPPTSGRVESAGRGGGGRAASTGRSGGAGIMLARPPDESLDDVEPLIEEALSEADDARRVRTGGDAVRPLLPPRAQRRPHARGEPRADRAERSARRRGCGGVRRQRRGSSSGLTAGRPSMLTALRSDE